MAKKKPIEQYEYKDNAERLAMLKKAARQINKDHGIDTLHFGNEHRSVEKIPVGFEPIDTLLGGGLPYGNFVTGWGAPGCFVAGTKILMGDYSWKNIEDIKVDETVMGFSKTKKLNSQRMLHPTKVSNAFERIMV